MNVGSDIKMFDIRSFDTYINDGWKEGFNITWKSKTDRFYTNTLLNKTNYDHATNTLTRGNTYTDEDTFSGWKFLFKPYSSTKLQWILLYTFVHSVSNGQGWFHYNCNLYDLVVDGKQMVSMPDTDTSQWQSNTAPVLSTSNGVGTGKSLTAQNGRTLQPGMLIHPVDQGDIESGTTQVVFYGTFTPTYTAGTENQTFQVKFRYTNWAYMAVLYGVKAIARNPENWSTSQSWGDGGSKTEFKDGKFTNTQTANITGTVTVTTLSSNYASYGQTVKIAGGNYVYAESPLTGSTTWSTGWKEQPYNAQLKGGLLTTSRSSARARSSFWSSTNYGSNWYAQKSFNLQYTPSVSNYQISSSSEDSVTITFRKHTPAGKSGYFNAICVRKSASAPVDERCYVEHDVTDSQVTITISRNGQNPSVIDIVSSVSGDYIVNDSLEVGLDSFTLRVYCCYHDTNDGHDHSNDLDGTLITYGFGSGFSITSFNLVYPLDSAGITHVFKDRRPFATYPGQYTTDFCMTFETTDSSSVGYAYISLGTHSQKFNISSGVNKVKLKDVLVSSGSYNLELQITNSSDTGSSDTAPTDKVIAQQSIGVSISTEDYDTNDFQRDKLVTPETYTYVVFPYIASSVANFATVFPEWDTIFQVNSSYVWDVNYTEAIYDILQNALITSSIKEVVYLLTEFYYEIQGLPEATWYSYWLGNHEIQESILKEYYIDTFIFDRVQPRFVSSTTIDGVNYCRYLLEVNDGNDIVYTEYQPSMTDTRYDLENQKVEFIKNDRYRLVPTTGKDDLIEVKADFEKDSTQVIIFNWYPSAIMYILQSIL